ncbi:MAG TPA: hypothetical protein VMO26_09765 [Vicinamibacterales bacterium]|nr:hypothetical protein [Vicinamibacterales bacterium]
MRIVVVAWFVVLAVPAPSFAWGFEAHKFIAERMIALLPDEIRPLFEQRRAYVVERAVDPDLWRNIFAEEAPNHFVDLDYFGKYPYPDLPRAYDRAVQRWGRDVIHAQGLLPWRVAELFGKLQREFEGLKRANAPGYLQDNIAFYATVMGHYVGDAHVPLHSVVNYDGQVTNQRGVHGRWESELFDRTRARLTIAPGPIRPVTDPREFMFETLLASNQLADAVLAADKRAAEGRESYDAAYFEAFGNDQFATLERRINESITALASMITAAWDAAGRPALPKALPRTPRPTPPPRG